MFRIFSVILIVFLIGVTAIIAVKMPKVHKPVLFESREFNLSLISNNAKSEVIKNYNLINPVEISIEIENKIENENIEQNNHRSEIEKNTNSVKIVSTGDKNKKVSVKDSVKKENQKLKAQQNSVVRIKTEQSKADLTLQNKKEPKKFEEKKIEQPAIKINSMPEENKIIQEDVLTEEELEIIAWNKWRSDLQNRLMMDSKISAPVGTSFLFSFTVDRTGVISNLKTWSNNPSYTQLAINKIKPVLLSYQNKDILKFPERSKRVITNVNGGFTMGYETRYSSPSDYNDYERVVK